MAITKAGNLVCIFFSFPKKHFVKPSTDQRHDKQQKSIFIGPSGDNCTLKKITAWMVRRVNDKRSIH